MEYAELSRRSLLALGVAATGVAANAGATISAAPQEPTDPWQRLVAGNRRFAAGRPRHPHQDPAYRATLVDAQHPIACVLGCADSRVPAEILFDQGLGDLFTVRAIELVDGDSEVTGAVDTVARAIESTVRATPGDPDQPAFLAACVRNQTTQVAAELTARSHAVRTIRPSIVTAVYELRTGLVTRH